MNNSKLVVMLSGGLDSFLAYRWAQAQGRDVTAVWMDIGQPYRNKELAAVQSLGVPVRIIPCGVLREEWDNVPTPEKQIIPGRNGLMAHVGSMYGDEVWLTALSGEMHEFMVDKNQAFFESASKYCSQIFGTPKIVKTPFADKSKATLVKWALANGVTREEMARTVTCYDADERACGKCSACFKRWVAMILNGVDEPFSTRPWESKWAKDYIPKIWDARKTGQHDHYSEKRCNETINALRLVGA